MLVPQVAFLRNRASEDEIHLATFLCLHPMMESFFGVLGLLQHPCCSVDLHRVVIVELLWMAKGVLFFPKSRNLGFCRHLAPARTVFGSLARCPHLTCCQNCDQEHQGYQSCVLGRLDVLKLVAENLVDLEGVLFATSRSLSTPVGRSWLQLCQCGSR